MFCLLIALTWITHPAGHRSNQSAHLRESVVHGLRERSHFVELCLSDAGHVEDVFVHAASVLEELVEVVHHVAKQ